MDPSEFVSEIGAGMSKNGRISELQVKRANGKVAYLQFPTEAAGTIMLTIEKAMGTLFEMQRQKLKGQDPRRFFPIGSKKVSKFQGGTSVDGMPILSLVLESGLRLDFGLPGSLVREMRDWLGEFEAHQNEPPSKTN